VINRQVIMCSATIGLQCKLRRL